MNSSPLHLISQNPQVENIKIEKSKILLGSAINCDFTFDNNSISHYHAMLSLDNQGNLIILDLQSANGIFINGQKILTPTIITEGDSLTLGSLHFDIIEDSDILKVENVEKELTILNTDEKIHVPVRQNENEILIDGEYCDIIFKEDHFTPLTKLPISSLNYENTSYEQLEEMEESFELEKSSYKSCVQVTTLACGNVLDQYYLPLIDKEYTASALASNGHIFIDIIESKSIPFISINNGNISVESLDGFSINDTSMDVNDKSKIIILTKGTFQIFIEISNVPQKLINIPALVRETPFIKESSKIFAGIMIPMLLLLFVNFKIPKEPKKLSIIYKKPTNTKVTGKNLASKNPTSDSKNTGHKKTKQPDKKIAHKKAGQKSKAKPMKAKKVSQKVAKQKSKSQPSPKKKAPVKAYQFKMASNVNSLFSKTKSVAKTNSRSIASISSNQALTGSLNTKVTGTASAKVGSMGSDLAGAQASMGSRGLSSKKGMDTSYIQTKTVVLGSMDPELLRKILQRYLPQFRHCYQQELANNSEDIKGIVDLQFEIAGSGRVGSINIKAKDNRFSKKGTDCMGKVLSIIDFPKPKGGGRVAVRQPLSFFAEQERS
jgi:pSer/pThr/pTyr-binding forkhead associated (FHA) protein